MVKTFVEILGMSSTAKLLSTIACIVLVVIVSNVETGTLFGVALAIGFGISLELLITKIYKHTVATPPEATRKQ